MISLAPKPKTPDVTSTTPRFQRPACPVPVEQLQSIFDDTLDEIVSGVELTDLEGHVYVERWRIDSLGPATSGDLPEVTVSVAPVQVRGKTVGMVRVTGLAGERSTCEHRADSTVRRIADSWKLAVEIESLAGEIVRVYDALHLIYEVGDTFSSLGGTPHEASVLLEKIATVLSAASGEFRLTNGLLVTTGEPTADNRDRIESPADGHRLSTELRNAGQRLGSVVLTREPGAPPFTSSDSKLLDGVGTLMAGAIRSTQLYDELLQHTEVLRQREVRLKAVLDSVADAIITVDDQDIIDSFNPSAEQIFGYSATEVVGQPIESLLPSIFESETNISWLRGADQRQTLAPRRELLGRRKDGSPIWMDLAMSAMPVGKHHARVVSLRDVSARKQSEEMLQHQALYDALTDLPNRHLLRTFLERLLVDGGKTSQSFATLLLDLDRFKDVNDIIGHQYGDLVLREVGNRLRKILRLSDLVARIGGDEFAVLLPGATVEGAAHVADKICKALEEPFEVDGYHLNVGVSVGIAMYPAHGEDPDILLRRADIAMYVAKRNHHSFDVFQADDDHDTPSRLQLMAELRSAIVLHELVLHYQPQVDLKTGKVSRVEALVRWQHPDRGLIQPSQFIGLAEQSGLIGPLTRWVLRTALKQCQAWMEQGLRICVAVNLSAQNLHDPWLPALIIELLEASRVPSELLQIEITESSLMADPARALVTLGTLSRAGVHISIDDFGTGYSSLAYLKRLPVNEIKIDRSFVCQMAGESNDEVLVRSIIGLGHDLGLTVVAEGVEESGTCQRLSTLNCDAVQGFYLSRPKPADELGQWLTTFPFPRRFAD